MVGILEWIVTYVLPAIIVIVIAFSIGGIIVNLVKSDHSLVTLFSCVIVVGAAICSVVDIKVPKPITLGITVFSIFWALSDLAGYSEWQQKYKEIVSRTLRLVGTAAIVIIFFMGVQNNSSFDSIDSNPIELMGFGVLLLIVAFNEKKK